METRQVLPVEQEQQSQVRPVFITPPTPPTVAPPPEMAAHAQTRPLRANQVMVRPARQTASAQDEATMSSGWPIGALVGAALIGTFVALLTIPSWVPTLALSISSSEPTVYWYLSRASGFVSFALLWLSMSSGLIITNKMARVWPGAFTAFDLHQYTSLLGLGFAFFHVLILLGNQYVPYNLVQLFVPFVDAPYRPLWIALGQVSLYLFILVTFTFYFRKQMGNRLWHIIHMLSYPVFATALLHGVFSGTDSGNLWMLAMYWAGAASLLALTVHRIANSKSFQVVEQ